MPVDIRDPTDETSALLRGNNNAIAENITGYDVNNDTPVPEELPSIQLVVVLLAVWVRYARFIYIMIY